MPDRYKEIKELFAMKEQGILTQAEFDQQKSSLLTPAAKLVESANTNGVNAPTSMELFAGTEIGTAGRKFRLVKELGAGGMGAVWQARDLAEEAVEFVEGQAEKPIYKALKVVNASQMHSSAAIKKLHQEAIHTAKLNHPNIINVFGWHQSEEGWLFVEMEYLQGKDLQTYLIDYETGLSWEKSQQLINSIIEAIHYAHHKHDTVIIHRDLKPANIYLTENQQIKILDFGLAYQMRKSSNSALKVTASTLEYMPPEAFFANKPDPLQDIYSLACIIYELLTGEPPFSREKAENRKADEYPPQPEELTTEAWQALQQGMAYDKKSRTPSVKQLWQNITRAQNNTVNKVEKVPLESSKKPEYSNLPTEEKSEIIDDFIGMELVYIKPGSFLMGSPENEIDRADEEYQHEVSISQGYYLGKYAVTQRQWQKVMRNNPAHFKSCGLDCPVENVSWDDIQTFIKKLNQQTGKHYRLPTEAEWEYAARAGTTSAFSFGDNITPAQVNYNGNYPYNGAAKGKYRETTVKVGSLPANAWGLHEMHGNVWEWVQDRYESGYYKNSPKNDPQGPAGGSYRVRRGGSWSYYARDVRSANRYRDSPSDSYNFLGFRLARTN